MRAHLFAVAPIAVACLTLGGALVGGVAAGQMVWENAPAVGGAGWPYIRAFVALVAFVIAAKVGAFAAYVVSSLAVLVLAAVFLGGDE